MYTSTHPLLTRCHAPTRRHTHGAAARWSRRTSEHVRAGPWISPSQPRPNPRQHNPNSTPRPPPNPNNHTCAHSMHTHAHTMHTPTTIVTVMTGNNHMPSLTARAVGPSTTPTTLSHTHPRRQHTAPHGARLLARGQPLRNPHHCAHSSPPTTTPLLRKPSSSHTLLSLSYMLAHATTSPSRNTAARPHTTPHTAHVHAPSGPHVLKVHTPTHPLLTACHAPTRRCTRAAVVRHHATPVNTSAPARGPVQVSPGETRVNTAQTAQPATAQFQQTHTRTHRAHTHTPCTHQEPSSLS